MSEFFQCPECGASHHLHPQLIEAKCRCGATVRPPKKVGSKGARDRPDSPLVTPGPRAPD